MSEAAAPTTPPDEAPAVSQGLSLRIRRLARRTPVTLGLIAALLVCGLIWGGLWTAFRLHPLYDLVSYGLPAFQRGRWWTVLTGTFFVAEPWMYLPTLASFAGLAYLEYRRGSLVALSYFAGAQLFAIVGTAALVWFGSTLPWPWAQEMALLTDVGPSGGTAAGLAAALALLPALWRVRGWLVMLAFVLVMALFWGDLADIEHALAVLLVLAVDRSLHPQRTTVREQRLIAMVAILMLAAIQLLTTLLPTDGPFGTTSPEDGPWVDVLFDTVVIALVANGLRRGRRWAWVVSITLSWLNIALSAFALVAVTWLVDPGDVEAAYGDLNATWALTVLWAGLLVYLYWTRGAFRARRNAALGSGPEPTVAEVKDVIRAHGGGTLSWMATWDGNDYFRASNGCIVPFQRRAGTAIALADPLGPAEGRPAAALEYIAAAELAGLIPCFFSAGADTAAAVPGAWLSLVVADDTLVDLTGLEFKGKRWQHVRSALNKAERDGVRFRLTRWADESWGVQQQLRGISEMWVGDKGLPEMGFTLGTLDEAADPEVRLALAVAANGDVDGFLSWLPVYAAGGTVTGWTLDLMRRRQGGFGSVMEFLIGSSARDFSAEGAQVVSLSGAPLAHENPPDAGVIADLTAKLADLIEPVYGFKSLHRFKQKFNPRFEQIYLLYRDEGDLTRISAGLVRAFLPDATLRQLAGAGVDLMRGEDEPVQR